MTRYTYRTYGTATPGLDPKTRLAMRRHLEASMQPTSVQVDDAPPNILRYRPLPFMIYIVLNKRFPPAFRLN